MVLVVVLIALAALHAAARDCNTLPVPPCPQRADRDLLFLVDASESMEISRFYVEMLDFTQTLYCAFDQRDLNRAGMIVFAENIREMIEFKQYSTVEWFAAVETLRATANVCCSCCTPTASAFALAKKVFQRVPSDSSYRIVFTITDGAPWQNEDNSEYGFPGMNPADYLYYAVPEAAGDIKKLGQDSSHSRVMLIGVPNKNGVPPRTAYFQGDPDPTKSPAGKPANYQCVVRNGKTTCATMKSPPFPIVSKPIDQNLFSTNSWDVQHLIDESVAAVCALLPTESPTPGPTNKPTTSGPTKKPTLAPTNLPTRLPTLMPTNKPTFLPSRSPTLSPTKRPTKFPTFAPSRSPSRAPTKRPTKQPTFIPTRSPTKRPTTFPTPRPTFTPTRSPTRSPFKLEMTGLDIYLLLDRSRSMRWVPDLCRRAPGGFPTEPDLTACWRLFVKFVGSIATKMANYPFRVTQKLGWQGQFADKRRGIRVSIYAFACTGNQRIPVTLVIGEKIDNPDSFATALQTLSALIPDGGTCPGEAIERAAAYSEGVIGTSGDDFVDRPFKTAILFTDGVFYDMDRPAKAAQGLFYFNVYTFALAISVPYNQTTYGLTPAEIQTQRQQLLTFVQGDESRLINFGLEGINTLDQIANTVVKRLPGIVVSRYYQILAKPYWCGWTNEIRCEMLDVSQIPTGLFCKWRTDVAPPGTLGVCLDNTWCNYPSMSSCTSDRFCYWNMRKCHTKDAYLTGLPMR